MDYNTEFLLNTREDRAVKSYTFAKNVKELMAKKREEEATLKAKLGLSGLPSSAPHIEQRIWKPIFWRTELWERGTFDATAIMTHNFKIAAAMYNEASEVLRNIQLLDQELDFLHLLLPQQAEYDARILQAVD